MNKPTTLQNPRIQGAYFYEFEGAAFDSRERMLYAGGVRHQLEPRVAGVLALLIQKGGAPVTRDEFLSTVWDDDGSDEALTQAISRLRRLIGAPDVIQTLPRIGYRLASEIRSATQPRFVRIAPRVRAWLKRPQATHAAAFSLGFALALALAGILGPSKEITQVEREIVYHPGTDGLDGAEVASLTQN